MKKTLMFAAIALVAFAGFSCKPKAEAPKAMFEYEVSEDDVTLVQFTNLSKNATAYKWEFGDNETSTETNPKHTYAEGGTYTITLTAEGEGGTNTYSEEISLVAPKVKIDGKFNDWDKMVADKEATLVQVELPEEAIGAGRESFKKAWCVTDADFIYYMFEFDNDLDVNMSFSFYIDADGNGDTGKDRDSYWQGMGAEYQLEYGDGDTENWTDWTIFYLYAFDEGGSTVDSKTQKMETPNDMSAVVPMNDGLARIEFRISRAIMSDLSNKSLWGCRFCNTDWSCDGQLPALVSDDEGSSYGLPGANFKF